MSLTGNVNSTGELQGKAESGGVLVGKLSGLKTIHGYSAYEVAVINGFSGTEKEWLASLKGEPGYTPRKDVDYFDGKDGYTPEKDKDYFDGYTPVRGKDYYTDEEKQAFAAEVITEVKEGFRPAKIGSVSLPASAWVTRASNLYAQVVSIDGVTEYSQVDLTPSVEQLAVFYDKDIAFVTENEDGVVTVYAIGQKPTNNYTIQVTITEVSV